MQNKTKISIATIIVVLGMGTGILAIENMEAQSIEHVSISGSVPNFSVEELSLGATHAIIGEVKKITPVLVERENRQYVFSDVLISVDRDLFNEYSEEEISVRIQGGEIDKHVTITEDDASFSVDEKVLVFVAGPEPKSIWGDNYYVAGIQNGKYALSEGKAIKSNSLVQIDESDLISQIQTIRGNK